MFLFSKILHVLALGLWFGIVVFFTLSGYLIFEQFKKESRLPPDKRPLWFPLPDAFDKEPPSPKFPNPLAEEQGSRAAGVAVTPLFPWYYGIQVVCGFIAYGTALSWQKWRDMDKAQSWRALILLLALIVTLAGWWLEGKVSELREPRNRKTDVVLTTKTPTAAEIAAAEEARGEFGKWHGISLIQNFATLILVTIALALAAQLPAPSCGQTFMAPEQNNNASSRAASTKV